MSLSEHHTFSLWQDRELRFDALPSVLKLRESERVIHEWQNVEDAKGNPGLLGSLALTNLRLIWRAATKARTNISVGYLTIKNMIVKEVKNSNKHDESTSSTLCISSRYRMVKYQFLFCIPSFGSKSLHTRALQGAGKDQSRFFSLAYTTWKAYENSMPYREVRLRTAITINSGMQLLLLPMEKIIGLYSLSICLSENSIFSGKFWVTNVRIVWIQAQKADFNISIPFVQMEDLALENYRQHFKGQNNAHNKKEGKESILIAKKEEKVLSVGQAQASNLQAASFIVVKTSPHGGHYKFSFFSLSAEESSRIYSEVCSLWKFSVVHPVLGVTVSTGNAPDGESGGGGGGSTKNVSTSLTTAGEQMRHQLGLCGPSGLPGPYSSSIQSNGGMFSTDDQRREEHSLLMDPGEAGVEEEGNIFDEAPSDGFAAYYSPEEEGKFVLEEEKEEAISSEGLKENIPFQEREKKGIFFLPECHPDLGLAIEPLRKGVTIEDLWKVSVK